MFPSLDTSSPSFRLVVVHQGALGDFLLMLPVLEGLHLSYPNLRVDFWSKKIHFDLIAAKPFAGNFHSCDGSEIMPFLHENPAREAPIPPFFRTAQAVLIFGQKSSRVLAATLGERLSCPVHWIHSFPAPDADPPSDLIPPLHTCEYLKAQIRSLGWSVTETFAHIEAGKDERSRVREWLAQRGISKEHRPLLIHPGSGGRKKIWPLSRWWNLLGWVQERHPQPVVMTLGPADEHLRKFAEEAQSLGAHPVEEISLPRLAAFMAESRLYVGSDSGVSHLAAAIGLPSVVIFGPTNPKIWAPQGSQVHIVRSHREESEVPAQPPQERGPEFTLEPQMREIMEKLISQKDE